MKATFGGQDKKIKYAYLSNPIFTGLFQLRDILTKFLMEAVTLTATGGVIGIALGSLLAFLISLVLTKVLVLNWPFTFPLMAAALGVGVAAVIGLVFGLYPARQVAKKSPMEALRYE